MGIGWSVHKNNGWHGQLDRTTRWYERIQALARQKSSYLIELEDLDIVFAFFQNCWHLREWVELSRDIPQEEISTFISSHPELQVCRDIANGTKHFHVTKPSVDPEFSIYMEIVPPYVKGDPRHTWHVIARDKYDLLELASACMALWKQFLSGRRRSSEHLYPGFSIFARDVLRTQVDEYQRQKHALGDAPDEAAKELLSTELERQRERLLRDLQHVLEGPWSFDNQEREVLFQQLTQVVDGEAPDLPAA